MKKARLPLYKALILAVMGGIFIGLGYLGYHLIVASSFVDGMVDKKTISENKFLASIIFPVGLMMVIFLGGSLFTSNSLLVLPFLERKIGARKLIIDWHLVWIGNLCGAILIAGLNTGAGIYDSAKMEATIIYFADSKAHAANWYEYFFSAIGCNMLVSGTVYMVFYAKSPVLKVFITFFGIFLFAISGYQHIVANFYAFMTVAFNKPNALDWGEVFYGSIIPVTIGNIIGGGVIIPGVYYIINKKVKKDGKNEKN